MVLMLFHIYMRAHFQNLPGFLIFFFKSFPRYISFRILFSIPFPILFNLDFEVGASCNGIVREIFGPWCSIFILHRFLSLGVTLPFTDYPHIVKTKTLLNRYRY